MPDTTPDPTTPVSLRRTSALAAIVAGLLIPGGGQLVVGRPGKALLFLITLGALFVGGLWMTSFTAIDIERHRLWLVAQAGIAGPSYLAWHLTHATIEPAIGRWVEIGQLYVGVAGILNLVAVTDAWGHALRHNDRVARWRLATSEMKEPRG